jgi:hypothetical protein
VPSVSAVSSGITDALLDELLDRDWPDDVAPMIDEIREGRTLLASALDFVKEQPDANYRRLHARRLVDIAVFLIIGTLFCDQATRSEKRKVIARQWLDVRMPDIQRNHTMIRSGAQLPMSEFETLAGGVAVVV